MIRVLGPGGLILFCAYVYAILDIIATDDILIRNLPSKMTWIFVVIIVPVVGIVAWFALGRPIGAGFAPGSTTTRPNRQWMDPEVRPRQPRGIEDRDDWEPTAAFSAGVDEGRESAAARERRLLEWEAELKRRESALGPDGATDEEDDS